MHSLLSKKAEGITSTPLSLCTLPLMESYGFSATVNIRAIGVVDVDYQSIVSMLPLRRRRHGCYFRQGRALKQISKSLTVVPLQFPLRIRSMPALPWRSLGVRRWPKSLDTMA